MHRAINPNYMEGNNTQKASKLSKIPQFQTKKALDTRPWDVSLGSAGQSPRNVAHRLAAMYAIGKKSYGDCLNVQ